MILLQPPIEWLRRTEFLMNMEIGYPQHRTHWPALCFKRSDILHLKTIEKIGKNRNIQLFAVTQQWCGKFTLTLVLIIYHQENYSLLYAESIFAGLYILKILPFLRLSLCYNFYVSFCLCSTYFFLPIFPMFHNDVFLCFLPVSIFRALPTWVTNPDT